MARKKKKDLAIGLASSMRGQWIIGRALRIAYLEMDKKSIERKEVSDMADMKLIAEELFPIGWKIQDIVEKQHEEYFNNGTQSIKLPTNDKEEGPIQDQSDADKGI